MLLAQGAQHAAADRHGSCSAPPPASLCIRPFWLQPSHLSTQQCRPPAAARVLSRPAPPPAAGQSPARFPQINHKISSVMRVCRSALFPHALQPQRYTSQQAAAAAALQPQQLSQTNSNSHPYRLQVAAVLNTSTHSQAHTLVQSTNNQSVATTTCSFLARRARSPCRQPAHKLRC